MLVSILPGRVLTHKLTLSLPAQPPLHSIYFFLSSFSLSLPPFFLPSFYLFSPLKSKLQHRSGVLWVVRTLSDFTSHPSPRPTLHQDPFRELDSFEADPLNSRAHTCPFLRDSCGGSRWDLYSSPPLLRLDRVHGCPVVAGALWESVSLTVPAPSYVCRL